MTQTFTPPARANLGTAPAVLNTNDRAMWVTGWNECLDAMSALQPQQDTTATPRDWELHCDECDGSGYHYAERESDVQPVREECECCDGRGFMFSFADMPGIEGYVRSCRAAPADAQTVRDAALEEAAKRIENGSFVHDDAPDARLSREAAKAIRALKHTASAPAADDLKDAARFRWLLDGSFSSGTRGWLREFGVTQRESHIRQEELKPLIIEGIDAAMQADAGKGE